MPPTPKKLLDKKWLEDMYIVQNRSIPDIAKDVGASVRTTREALHRLGIPLKGPLSKYPLLNDKNWLKDVYENQKWSTKRIADYVGCHSGLICDMLHRIGVKTRSWSESQSLRFMREGHGVNWKGGRVITTNGYILIFAPDHPNAPPNGYVLEHRIVMEKVLGRHLEDSETVHHVDGDKQNNDPSNLVVMKREQHKMTHKQIIKHLAWVENRLRLYEERFGPIEND